jgi:hypothetical protein
MGHGIALNRIVSCYGSGKKLRHTIGPTGFYHILGCLLYSQIKAREAFGVESAIERHYSRFFEFGSMGDGYWGAEDVIGHTCDIAIPMFETVFPGCQALFLFDNAQSNASYAEDALLAQNMNLGRGGEQKRLRPSVGNSTQFVRTYQTAVRFHLLKRALVRTKIGILSYVSLSRVRTDLWVLKIGGPNHLSGAPGAKRKLFIRNPNCWEIGNID